MLFCYLSKPCQQAHQLTRLALYLVTTQLFTIIPYACAFASLFAAVRTSDRLGARAYPTLLLTAVAIVGFVIMLATPNAVAGIVGACLICAAAYPAIVICSAWIPSSHAGYTKRASAVWIAQILIQSFSIMATQIYTNAPRFFAGHGTLLGLMLLTFASILTLRFLMQRSNRQKDKLAAEWDERGERNPDEDKSLEELCDKHPDYRYVY